MKFATLIALSMALAASARPNLRPVKRQGFALKNGQDAIAENEKFKALTPDSPCQQGENACVNDQFAQCVNGKFVLQPCAATLVCASLPLVNSPGTSIACTTPADRDARIAATGAVAGGNGGNGGNGGAAAGDNAANGNGAVGNGGKGQGNGGAGNGGNGGADNGDPQKSLTLAPGSIQPNYANDGNANAAAGQEPSITSTNNFINFCLQFPDKAQTNGQQVTAGSCNQTPMGVIAAQAKMPFAKFQNPPNGGTVAANKDFTISVLVQNMELGHFTNPDTTFHMAPQQVNGQGQIKGHSHVTVQKLNALGQVDPVAATEFVFFKGLNDKGNNGVLSVTVPGGLPAGFYRAATINSAANHQPALVAVAQRGALDDMVYFTVQ